MRERNLRHMHTVTTRNDDGTFDIVQRASAPVAHSSEDLQRLYWREVRSTTLGLVRFSRGALRIFGRWPTLLVFGPSVEGRRLIVGGIFARHPYGAIAWSCESGEVVVALERFAPRLRGPFFRAEQWFHDVVGRRFLERTARAEN
jgi:hypothetical protein